ncbi:hypothetical protein D3C72_2043900 [compost metagenome]
MARIAADEERWVIEGGYGWIVSEILHRATALIWLCIDDVDCVANIRRREANDDERLVAMLEWANNYRTRDDSSGFAAHQRMFDDFGASKIRLTNRVEITDFASEAGILPIG